MNQDERLDRLISYNFFGYQNTDLMAQFSDTLSYINLRQNSNLVKIEITACILGFLNRHDSSYLMYAYKFKEKEYGFAWEILGAELDDEAEDGVTDAWFDFIQVGDTFNIKIDKKKPEVHFIIDKPFSAMNGPVLKLGLPQATAS